jgi:hypothetical protein
MLIWPSLVPRLLLYTLFRTNFIVVMLEIAELFSDDVIQLKKIKYQLGRRYHYQPIISHPCQIRLKELEK